MFVCFVLCYVFFPFEGRGTSVRNSLKFANICNKKNGDKKWIDVSSNKRTRTNCFLAKRLQERLSAFENYPLLFWAHNRFYIIEQIRVKRDRTSLGKPCLVPRPHYYARPMRFGSRGPRKFLMASPGRSSRIRHRNALTERAWKDTV